MDPVSLDFRVPRALRVTEAIPRRALVVASCFAGSLPGYLRQAGSDGDLIVFNNLAEMPEQPPKPLGEYDLQIIQIPIRTVLPEKLYFPGLGSEAAFDSIFEEAEARLQQLLAAAMQWNREHGLLSFIYNFMTPQYKSLGVMVDSRDRRNLARLFRQLNDSLSAEVATYRNSYVVDCDEISASLGRRYIQDDAYQLSTHASTLMDDDGDLESGRLQKPAPLNMVYPNKTEDFNLSVIEEIFSMYRIVKGADAVKLVIVDLDDTLWRGMAIENWQSGGHASEGWPLGFAEALLYLKARGIVLAIVSKNDAEKVAAVWDHVWLGRLSLDDFAVREINWRPKAENVEAVIRAVNVRPDSVVFIDDNPTERAAVQAAFPEIRVLGDDPYVLRRILLCSPETQVARITDESARRTEMIQSQVKREDARARLSREEFLASLNVRITAFSIINIGDDQFPRALELINKTNQFNTTGRRLTLEQCKAAFDDGAIFHAFEVEDKYTHYGLVGVAIIRAQHIEQFVMSCRVIGLEVETSVIDDIVRSIHAGGTEQVTAAVLETDANQLSRDLFRHSGFAAQDGLWVHLAEGQAE